MTMCCGGGAHPCRECLSDRHTSTIGPLPPSEGACQLAREAALVLRANTAEARVAELEGYLERIVKLEKNTPYVAELARKALKGGGD